MTSTHTKASVPGSKQAGMSESVVIGGKTITLSDIKELEKAREAKARQRAYHKIRNQKSDVKVKSAEYHERRNHKLRAFAAAFAWLRDNKKLTDSLLYEVEDAVPVLKEYVALYETADDNETEDKKGGDE